MGRAKRLREMRPAAPDARPVAEIVEELRKSQPVSDYREQSLRIHGLICAKCGREFEPADRRLLTVHHRDGNHPQQPAGRLELGEPLRLLPRRRAQPRRARGVLPQGAGRLKRDRPPGIGPCGEGVKPISSIRNPALQRYRDLREAAVRRETGLAAAEGFNLLREALLSDTDLVQVFLERAGTAAPRLRRPWRRGSRRARLPGAGSATRSPGEVLERAAHTESPQGALAVFRPRPVHARGGALRGKGPSCW